MLPEGGSATLVSQEELKACVGDLLECLLERLVEKHKEQLQNLCQTILGALARDSDGVNDGHPDSLRNAAVRPSAAVRFSTVHAVPPDVLGKVGETYVSSQDVTLHTEIEGGNDVHVGDLNRRSYIAEASGNHRKREASEISHCSELLGASEISRCSELPCRQREPAFRGSVYSALSDSMTFASEMLPHSALPDRASQKQVGMFAIRRSSIHSSLGDNILKSAESHQSGFDRKSRMSRMSHISQISRRSRISHVDPKALDKSAMQLKEHMLQVIAQHRARASTESTEENDSDTASDADAGESSRVARTTAPVRFSVFSVSGSQSSGGGLLATVKNISSNPFREKYAKKERSTISMKSISLPNSLTSKALRAQHACERHWPYLCCRASCGVICLFNRKLVTSAFFDSFCAAVILAFMVLLGIETNALSQSNGRRIQTFDDATLIFNMWFIIELLMRIAAQGINFFWDSPELAMNIMDTCLVLTSVVDIIFGLTGSSMDSSLDVSRLARVIRILRLIRAVRLARVMQHVIQFRKMVYLIQGSMGTLFWCLLLLFLVIYVFAVLFTQGVTDYLRDKQWPEEEQLDGIDKSLKEYYGSMPRSISSLFQSMSNGISWSYVFQSMIDMGWMYSVAFIAFIAFSMFGVLNVLTSVFVESTVQIAMTHRDIIQHDHEKHMEIAIQHLREVFNAIDHTGTGTMLRDDMECLIQDPFVYSYLEALDINLHDSSTLFKLLDADGSGEIDIEEFCQGCLKLKGTARSFDLHCLINEISRFLDKWSGFTDYTVSRFNHIEADLVDIRSLLDHRLAKVGDVCKDDIRQAQSDKSVNFAL